MKAFIEQIKNSIANKEFAKLTLSRGRQKNLKNSYFKLVNLKKGMALNESYQIDTQQISKNYEIGQGLEKIEQYLSKDFGQGILFSLKEDIHIRVSPHGSCKTKHFPPTFSQVPPMDHDKVKQRPIESNKGYLEQLGISDSEGRIKSDMQSKYRQINRFIELLAPYLNRTNTNKEPLHLVDMGSGKGYLTFALYDYLANKLAYPVQMEGIELRPHLVELCNRVAVESEFEGLQFKQSSIEELTLSNTDILIALHACNTATDDALYKGITAGAKLIVVAPCCHKQVRQNMAPTNSIQSITQYGIFKERSAELLTDTLRALLLESKGYQTSIVEFINSEHTAKNIMLIAEKRSKRIDTSKAEKDIKELKALFGISKHYLEELLNNENNH